MHIPTVRSVSIVRGLLNCLCTPLSQLPRLGKYTREILVFYFDDRVFKLLINGCGGGGGGDGIIDFLLYFNLVFKFLSVVPQSERGGSCLRRLVLLKSHI